MENKNEKRAALLQKIVKMSDEIGKLIYEFNKLGYDEPGAPSIHRAGGEARGYGYYSDVFCDKCGELVDYKHCVDFDPYSFYHHKRYTMMGNVKVFEIGNFEKEMQA